jgi:DNA-binding NarL/FixJ family response regulator
VQPTAITVLLVEDDPRVRRSVRWTLEDAGMRVEEFHRGEPLLPRAASNDVVVLDIAAGGSGDLSGLEELAADGSTTPRIVFTAYAQPYLRSAAAAMGARAFLDRASTEADLLVEVVRAVVVTG